MKHKATDFNFAGIIIGEFSSSGGHELCAVEEDGSHYITVFGAHSLLPLDPEPVKIPVISKMTLPYELYVPIKAIPYAGPNRRASGVKIREEYLWPQPREALLTENVDAEVEFHFKNHRSGDIDNLLKPTLDLLKGSVIRDDGQILSLRSHIIENSDKEGFIVRLQPHETKG